MPVLIGATVDVVLMTGFRTRVERRGVATGSTAASAWSSSGSLGTRSEIDFCFSRYNSQRYEASDREVNILRVMGDAAVDG